MSISNNIPNQKLPLQGAGGLIAILGAGESGVGAAYLAQQQGYDVFVSDFGAIADHYKKQLQDWKIRFEENGHTEAEILNAVEVVKSPGIPDGAPMVKKLVEQGTPVISEIEFAGRYTDAKMICITGSNGKTTTASLTYHILKNGGLNVGLAGNIGKSFAYQVATEKFDHYVLEISSFMLDSMYKFRADIAVLLNITPDHLDRYEYKLENYAASKFRITQNQTGADHFIYCADDAETIKVMEGKTIAARQLPFSIEKTIETGAYLDKDNLIINVHQQHFQMSINELALQGKHNIYNSMASGIVAKVLELRNETMRESMGSFRNIEHRLESVGKISGISFINDSKATNVNSTWYALESMTSDVVLILGGVDKGNDYSMLKQLVKQKVKAIVCLGKDNKRIHDAFEDDVEVIVNTMSAAEAAQVAYHLAEKGDTVLLSPACASFDLFKNYEDRGKQFKDAVKEL
ncbi:UDP-N-acetylmuramoyl-L-alanine--D-glutamate ligase [Mucilaginibacter phyllosphaerae]|uniref:UDP-N-acetylmuramoylalanine--D-glutamate ligase n=1 Tax=Mucilaginibacter phyllosphaerae TaxID=1812349 RepID=A0A4Y8AGH5_9SPHI|nr:UDP-N-acetylmuramoyl-L-alanine--D-glutamate ligase [Mucilaginibacter phyllosphaerae]MBB3968513.1 UDP-N-acetylmuramoylalanine--D-glutamate ligase [Mucilaginibacter phyllosphaerae]TEW67844.1 UDP-N-acetylmuramoyl-L-alanine--D-glutamate ligase [Mucilaginibacter phyllosphaerae]GGH15549.1 UDP-N-acetylmuramoylalanine--D-glutamate ligase [Mucilaginibacter phyllosphaerae]